MNAGFNKWNNGFGITFDNGVTVAVAFGWSNNCSNRRGSRVIPSNIGSSDAEVHITDNEGRSIITDFDSSLSPEFAIAGWCTPDYVLAALVWASGYQEGG